MSKHLCINTPLPITVGNKRYRFITYQDLFRICFNDPSLLREMIKNPKDIGIILEKRKLVLASKCLEALIELLSDPAMMALARKRLRQGVWPTAKIAFWGDTKSKMYGEPCTWPNCPPD